MLCITKSSLSEHGRLAGLQPKVPVILRSLINTHTHKHILLLTVDFAVNLGSGLRWREQKVICL